MIWGKSSSKEYEEYVERALLRKYTKGQWILEKQSPIKGTRDRVDFRLTNRKTGRLLRAGDA